ncbi:MAG: CvpA family protein [Chitinophagales bacterium]
MTLNSIDIAFIITLIIGIYKGMTSGFAQSILGFAKILLAIFITLRFSSIPAAIIRRFVPAVGAYAPIVGLIITLVFALSFIYVSSMLLNSFMKRTYLGKFNQVFGIALWLFLLCFGFSYMLFIGEELNLIDGNLQATSTVYPIVSPIADIVSCKLAFIDPATSKILGAIQTLFGDLADAAQGDCR